MSDLETESDFELEDEFEMEDDLASEEPELEGDWQGEDGEPDLEADFEADFDDQDEAFLGGAWDWLGRSGSPQRRLALMAARAALRGGGAFAGGALGGRFGHPRLGRVLGGSLGGGLAGLLPDREAEWEWEGECEGECEDAAGALDAAMSHLGDLASRVDSNAEAEAFLGALVPLAARLIPRAASVLRRASPAVTRGISALTRTLRSSPQGRRMVRAVPTIVRRTAYDLARQYARSGRMTPARAARTLARNTANTLADRRSLVRALQRCRLQNRRYLRMLRASRARLI
ncbi:MAG: hypothetical protein IPM29_06930 [Planctomycetes bacterium]|nr:hypothetical protein [Planctomycetota bacterium]